MCFAILLIFYGHVLSSLPLLRIFGIRIEIAEKILKQCERTRKNIVGFALDVYRVRRYVLFTSERISII